VSRIRKKTFYLQFCMGTPEGHQKSIFNTQKVKKKQRYIWDLSTEFAGLTQNPKKISEHQIYQSGRTFFQKSMLGTLKKKRSQKFVWGLPDEICRLNPKS
jgi:hypothetical protein